MDSQTAAPGLAPVVTTAKPKQCAAEQLVKMTCCEINPNSRKVVTVRGVAAIRRLQRVRDEVAEMQSEWLRSLHWATRDRLEEYWGDEPDEFLTITNRAPDSIAAERDNREWKMSIDWSAILAAHEWRCLYCGEAAARLEADHIWPKSRGGLDDASNIAPACGACNNSKHAKHLGEWLAARTDLSPRSIIERWRAAGRGVPLGIEGAGP
jgi:5-methylcytosine-specific restriction endonuclease McrA